MGLLVNTGTFDPLEGCSGNGYINNVLIDAPGDGIFSSGKYYVCLKAKDGRSDYSLYKESGSGSYRGFNYRGDNFNLVAAESNKGINYAIFLSEYKYANANNLNQIDFSGYLSEVDVNNYIDEIKKYENKK